MDIKALWAKGLATVQTWPEVALILSVFQIIGWLFRGVRFLIGF